MASPPEGDCACVHRLPGGKVVDIPSSVQVRMLDMSAGGTCEQPAATRP
jgi:hypothetical protein